MEIKPIEMQADYRDALMLIESLMTAKATTAEGNQLDALPTLVATYERTHFPMDQPAAVPSSSVAVRHDRWQW
jgi:HTH-type transcriptional regulator/antitoxin HigA